jgi:uncharacterized protein YndB with AHSA1/START domain
MKPEVTLEVIYPYPPERVWRALTDPQRLAEWLLPNNFIPRLGHRFQFLKPPAGNDREIIQCEVIDCQPPSRLAYTWRGPADPAPSLVTWTLEAVPAGTRLRLTHTRAEEAAGASHEAGAPRADAWEHPLVALLRVLRNEMSQIGEEPRWPTTVSSGGQPALWPPAA